jgi:hypothetical protein
LHPINNSILFPHLSTGPKEQQSGESSIEGILNVCFCFLLCYSIFPIPRLQISLHGCLDPAQRYSVEHALRAVVCLRQLARTEVHVELNVLANDGGALAACLMAAGVAIASANIEM